jgi:hypothetical protein
VSFDTTTKERMFDSLRTAVGATAHYVKLSTLGGAAVPAIRKASTRLDNVTGAGLDATTAGRVLVKSSAFVMPDNRRIYTTTDGGTTYTPGRIQSVHVLADAITAVEFDSLNRGAVE